MCHRAQVVGWPPIRSYRKNTMAANPSKNKDDAKGKQGLECLYVKVSMDGAPYLRKVDLKTYSNYKELSLALEKMFTCFTIGKIFWFMMHTDLAFSSLCFSWEKKASHCLLCIRIGFFSFSDIDSI